MSAMDDVFGPRENRPKHPDFWLLSELVLKLDGRMDATPEAEKEAVWLKTVGEHIDVESLTYVAIQRALRINEGQMNDTILKLASLYLDAFIMGCEFNQRKHDG